MKVVVWSSTASLVARAAHDYAVTAYADLYAGVPVAIAGIVLFGAGACFAARQLARHFGRNVADGRKLLRIVAAFTVVAAIALAAFDIDTFGGAVPFAVACAMGCAALVGLALSPRLGFIFVLAFFIWCFALICLGYIDAANLGYSSFGGCGGVLQLTTFSLSHFLMFRVFIIVAWLIVLSAVVAWCVSSRCDRLPARQRSIWYSGWHIDARRQFLWAVANGLGRGLALLAKATAILLLISYLVIMPRALTDVVPTALSSGTAALTNAYTSTLAEYRSDAAVIHDDRWVGEFASTSDLLIEADLRFTQVDLQALNWVNISFFALYAEASCNQVAAIEDITHCVAQGLSVEEPVSRFNDSVDEMALAARTASDIDVGYSPLSVALNVLCDGVYSYAGKHGLAWFGASLSIAGVVLLVLGALSKILLRRRIGREASSEGVRGAHAASREEGSCATVKVASLGHAAALLKKIARAGRLRGAALSVVAIALTVALLIVAPMVVKIHEAQERGVYIADVTDIVVNRPINIAELIGMARGQEDDGARLVFLQAALKVVTEQMDDMGSLHEMEGAPDAAGAFREAFEDVYPEEMEALAKIRESLEAGQLPGTEEMLAYSDLLRTGQGLEMYREYRNLLIRASVFDAAVLAGF